jgi:hypothetical protein
LARGIPGGGLFRRSTQFRNFSRQRFFAILSAIAVCAAFDQGLRFPKSGIDAG